MPLNDFTIIGITDPVNTDNSVSIIRDSFKTVAEEFGLTTDNCPTHPSFITIHQLNEFRSKGVKFFGFFLDSKQVGLIAIEKADASLYYIEKLAVLPAYRHLGCGAKLMEFAFDYIKENKGKKVSIAIIEEHTVLKNWYMGLGFKEAATKKFPHLPFTVCFMEQELVPLGPA